MKHLAILAPLMTIGLAAADETRTAPFQSPPKLRLLFEDNFAEDTRSRYNIEGAVGWKEGGVTIPQGGSLSRKVNAGWWAECKLDLNFSKPSQEGGQSAVHIRLVFDDNKDITVQLLRQRKNRTTTGRILVFEESQKSTKSKLVREFDPVQVQDGRWLISYRFGLLSIVPPDGSDCFAEIRNRSSSVSSIQISSTGETVSMHRLESSGIGQPRFSPDESAQLDRAAELNKEVLTLTRKAKYREAIKLSDEVIKIRKRIQGEFDPEYAESLNNRARLHRRLDELAEAQAMFRRATEIWERTLSRRHPMYAVGLDNLAVVLMNRREFDAARRLAEQSLSVREKVLGRRHPQYLVGMHNLGVLYAQLGDYEGAEKVLSETVKARREVLGEKHRHLLLSMRDLAAVCRLRGDLKRCVKLAGEVVEIQRKVVGDLHPDYGLSLRVLADACFDLHDYAKAEDWLRQALAVFEKSLGKQHPFYINTLRMQAQRLLDHGWSVGVDGRDGEQICRDLVELTRNRDGEKSEAYAESLRYLAIALALAGDYAQAVPLHRRSLELLRQIHNESSTQYASALNDFAHLYLKMGNYERATIMFQRAREIFEQAGDDYAYASCLNNLAFIYQNRGAYDEAERLFERATATMKKMLGDKHPRYALMQSNLGVLYLQAGEYGKAKDRLQLAGEIREQVYGARHPSYAHIAHNLASVHLERKEYDRAESLYAKARTLRKELLGDRHPEYVESTYLLGRLYFHREEYDRAEPLLRQALSASRSYLKDAAVSQTEIQQLQHASSLRFHLNAYVKLALESGKFGAECYHEVLAWKGATLARQSQYRRVAEQPGLRGVFAELQRVTTRFISLVQSPPTKPQAKASRAQHKAWKQRRQTWEQQVADISDRKEELELRLSTNSSEFRRSRQPVTLKQIHSVLPADSALVDFLELGRRLIAFVIRPGRQPKPIDLGRVATISAAIDTWRKPMTPEHDTPKNRAAAAAAGKLLRSLVWEPLEERLDGVSTVLVSPDGALCRLPLAALPGRQAGSYLIEKYHICYLPVPRLLPALVKRRAEPQNRPSTLLAFGNIDYDGKPRGELVAQKVAQKIGRASSRSLYEQRNFGRLAGTADEVAEIAELFTAADRARILTGRRATEVAFRELGPRYTIVHLATHGFYAPPKYGDSDPYRRMIDVFNPGLLSGLALAGANRQPEPDQHDGILTALEIAFTPLENVDLVVLSACDTAVGLKARNEGLLGVQRAFQVAGARTTVASLWKVDDIATQRLMEQFYRNYLEEKMPRGKALREAQLWMLDNPQSVNPSVSRGDVRKLKRKKASPAKRAAGTSPRYWAAFVLSGEWR